ncbi:site-specific integrase [Variovorax sp. E3]|uniref:site-specific integrase n=1 Tax=Variovorax sp. E3 TaxID=1914993 RepID=UPI0027DB1B07|nr:site-specific integrase [Variovorax sp. E3]
MATGEKTKPSAMVQGYAAASAADSTRRSYAQSMRHFQAWGGKVPATAGMVAEYIASCGGSLKTSTIAHRLAAINRAHQDRGFESPVKAPLVKRTMEGIRRSCGVPPRRVRALGKSDLVEILVSVAKQKPLKAARDKAILLLGWAAALRRSELVALTVEDIVTYDTGCDLLIRRSKTDQRGAGQMVFVPIAKSKERCPIIALQAWLEMAEITSGPLFRQVSRHDYLVGERGLTGQAIAQVVQAAVRTARGPEAAAECAAHSLRAGFVTEAASVGVPVNEIMNTTRHTSVATLYVYIRPVEKRRAQSLL